MRNAIISLIGEKQRKKEHKIVSEANARLKMYIIIIVLLSLLLNTTLSYAISPEGPSTLQVLNSSKRTPNSAASLAAEAGNVTILNVVGNTVTQSWQGFVGNISGSLTLDNYKNDTLYNWTLTAPEGEIYATYLSTVDWTSTIECWNWSMDTESDAYGLSLGELEGWDPAIGVVPGNGNISVGEHDVDGINETFNLQTHPEFYVGTAKIEANTCHSVALYNGTKAGIFREVLLYHNASDSVNDGVIYTSLISNDLIGFNNQTWDFQMIVGENGHAGNTAPTTYYFYIELE